MKTNLQDLLTFTSFLNTFRAVKRTIYLPGTTELENDVEHSYHLAMLGWYIASTEDLDLDKEKIISYALIHDLVEVYAGDTFIYDADETVHITKAAREDEAYTRIVIEFPEFKALHEMIRAYEARIDKESRFIYALDKIHPILQIYLDEGKIWKENAITLPMLLNKKDEKIRISEELLPFWEELVNILEQEEKKLFLK